MLVEIDLKKSVEQNAAFFFDKSKKARQKLASLEKAIVQMELQIALLDKKQTEKQAITPIKKRKKQWFEQFHWFFSSDCYLVIGGKDAKQNEEIVKSRMEKTDLFFHADIFGAPHCILKSSNNFAPEQSLKEAAQFAVVFSRAWQSNAALANVYSVLPEQVSKQAPSGESIGKGAFMVYGERKWFKHTQLSIAIGLEKIEGSFRVISGPESAIKKHAIAFVALQQGNEKKSDAAKKILALLRKKVSEAAIDLDEIMQMLPNGRMKVVAE